MAAERIARVLLTADTVGGVWTYAVELAYALRTRGIEVHVATMGAPLSASQRRDARDLPVHESTYRLEWMDDPWQDLQDAGEWLLDLAHELRPDVVHLNQFAFGALPFAAPKVLVAHSCVCSWWRAVHGVEAPAEWDRYRATVMQGLHAADRVIAPTHAMLANLGREYAFAGGGAVIANGRRANLFRPLAKEPIVCAAGRLWDEAKNLEALDAVAAHVPWPIQVAGSTRRPDGTDRGGVHVRNLGELAPATLAQHLGRAAIYALPARYEPFGLSVLEAALAGCALVLGDIPSLREVWGEAAMYVPPNDHDALRRAIVQLIEHPALREHSALLARARALAYGADRMADEYLAVYGDVAHRQRARRTISPPSGQKERACAS